MRLGKIESIWRYPVKGMKGEQIDHIYAACSGLIGDRIYGDVAEDGDPAFPWHTGRKLRIHLTQKGQHDCRPLSIFSLSAA